MADRSSTVDDENTFHDLCEIVVHETDDEFGTGKQHSACCEETTHSSVVEVCMFEKLVKSSANSLLQLVYVFL